MGSVMPPLDGGLGMSGWVPYDEVSTDSDAPVAGSGSGLSRGPGFRRTALRNESPGASLWLAAGAGSAAGRQRREGLVYGCARDRPA